MNSTNLILWNAGGINNKKEEIVNELKEIDISIITEIKNKRLSNLSFTGFNVIMENKYN